MALYKYAYDYCNYYYYYYKDSEFLVQFYMCCGICWLGYVVRNSKAVCRQADAWIQESTDWTGQDHTWWDEKFTHANNQFFLKTRFDWLELESGFRRSNAFSVFQTSVLLEHSVGFTFSSTTIGVLRIWELLCCLLRDILLVVVWQFL